MKTIKEVIQRITEESATDRFIRIAYQMFSRLDDDVNIVELEIMWEALMQKMGVCCSDMDLFIDRINSVRAAKDFHYFKSMCEGFLSEKLPF